MQALRGLREERRSDLKRHFSIVNADVLDETPDELLALLRRTLFKKPIQVPQALGDRLGLNLDVFPCKAGHVRVGLELIQVLFEPLDFALEGGPGVGLAQALSDFSEAFCQAFRLLEASGMYLVYCLAELVKELGTLKDPSRYPSLFELREFLEHGSERAGKGSQYNETVLWRVRGLLSFFGHLFRSSRGFPFERALCDQKTLVLEGDGVRDEVVLFVTLSIMLRIFSFMLGPASKKPEQGVGIFADDNAEIFNINLERRVDEPLPIAGKMASRYRVAGPIVAALQVPSLASKMLLQNLGTIILLRMGNADEAALAGRSIGMTDDEIPQLLELRVGEAICFKESYPRAVKVRIEADPRILV